MESRTHDRAPTADAVEFVRFCYRRRRVGWPELYDEMCAVAGRGIFRGWGSDELGAEGIGFSLFEMPALAVLVHRVVAEEHAKRSAVAPAAVVRSPLAAVAAAGSMAVAAEGAGAVPVIDPATVVRTAPPTALDAAIDDAAEPVPGLTFARAPAGP